MKKNRILMRALAVYVCAAPFTGGVASAAFYIAPSTPPAAVAPQAQPPATATAPRAGAAAGQAVVMHQGSEPALVSPAVGMGKNIPLMIALQQIVPAGWYVLPEQGDIPVSWKGSSSWVGTLTEMLSQINAHAVIDWDKQTVRVYASQAEATAAAPAVETEVVSETEIIAPPKPESWVIRVEDNLISSTLQRWTDEAQEKGGFWKVSWESPMDFPVMFNAQFTGSFEEAVTQLVRSLASTEAPVQAIIYENHVVRIVPIGTKIK